MKKILPIVLLSLWGWLTLYASAQDQFPNVEKVTLLTDRYLYISGEDICFSAFIEDREDARQMSNILYAEIITSTGRSMSAGKFIIDQSTASGCIKVPDSLMSGVYYFRAYTKYMRNAGPESYDYLALKIVNPYRKDVMSGDMPIAKLSKQEEDTKDQSIDIILEKNEFGKGEEIQAVIKRMPTRKIITSRLTVVPDLISPVYRYAFENVTRKVNGIKYYPETRGATLTGILQDNKTDSIIAGEIMNLSITGVGKDFMATRTDKDGKFYFSLPFMKGSRDIFLGTSNKLSERSRILVDNDYCTMPVSLPAIQFTLSEEERSLALGMAVKLQLRQAYANDSLYSLNVDTNTRGFYGTPVHELMLEDYVQLPNLEEYFNELPGYVKVRRSGGQKYFKVLGSQVEMDFYEPLVLVDWVAIDHPENVLSIVPLSVVKIEMINEPYIKGDFIYGGVISIISKRANFAGINLPQSGIFVNYLFSSTNESPSNEIDNDTPDYRNTIYKEINPQFSEDNNLEIMFKAPSQPGSYKVVMKGIMDDSSIFIIDQSFEVVSL